MHEFAIATQIVESVLEEAKRHSAKKVAEVHLTIGKLTFLGVDQVHFSYEILVKDTIMKDSKLIITEQDGIIECPSCGEAFLLSKAILRSKTNWEKLFSAIL